MFWGCPLSVHMCTAVMYAFVLGLGFSFTGWLSTSDLELKQTSSKMLSIHLKVV